MSVPKVSAMQRQAAMQRKHLLKLFFRAKEKHHVQLTSMHFSISVELHREAQCCNIKPFKLIDKVANFVTTRTELTACIVCSVPFFSGYFPSVKYHICR